MGFSKHCRQKHEWRWSRDVPEYWHAVWVQTFFKTGGFQKYFTVLWGGNEATIEGEGESDGGLDAMRRQEIDLIEEVWPGEMAEMEKQLEVVAASMAKQDGTDWCHRTEWSDRLCGSNLVHLFRAGRWPDCQEEHLQRLVRLAGEVVQQTTLGLRSIHPDVRPWLKNPKPNEAHVRPFSRLQNRESQWTYVRYFQRFFCYLFRVFEAKARLESLEAARQQGQMWEEEPCDSDDEDNDEEEEEADHDAHQPGRAGSTVEENEMTKARRRWMGDMYDAVRLSPWTPGQLEKMKRLVEVIKSDGHGQKESLLAVCESVICQHLMQDVYRSPLVQFLAILGIDGEMRRFRQAHDFSYVLAGLVWIIRLLFMEIYLPSAKRDQQGKGEIKQFLAHRVDFLTDGSFSPMSSILSLLAYSKSIAMKFGNAGMIQWSQDKQVMSINGRPIHMQRFRTMVDKVILHAETVLWYDLMWEDDGCESKFEIPLEDIEDDVTFSKRGYSFVDNPRNGLSSGRTFMLEKMMKSGRGRVLRKKDYSWDRRRVKRYLRAVDKFQRLLLFAVHVAGGQPARGPEITSLRFKNGFYQDRNVFLIHGQVVTVTRYHKSASQFDSPKIIPRFLPWRVGQLFAVYITYIQPFQELLSVHVLKHDWTEYIWSDARGPWETDKLSSIISTETSKHLGIRLTTLSYRHSAAAIGRTKVGAKFAKGYQAEIGEVEEEEVDDEVEDEIELGAGRTTKTGELRYGVSGNVIKHLSQRSMDAFRPMCEKWHAFLGLASYKESSKKRGRYEEH